LDKEGVSVKMEAQDSINRLRRNVQKRYNRIAAVYDLMDKITVPHRMREKTINLARDDRSFPLMVLHIISRNNY